MSRYDFRAELGYDIPPRVAQFGPPTNWPMVDAAGVPVQVVRVETLTEFKQSGWDTYTMALTTVSGDTGYPFTATGAWLASLRQSGGRRRAGYLYWNLQGFGDPPTSQSFWWYGLTDDAFATTYAVPTVAPAVQATLDKSVSVGDFIVIEPA